MLKDSKRTVDRTSEEVATIIEKFLDGQSGPWDWDDFISFPITDRLLDEIRERCNRLSTTFLRRSARTTVGPAASKSCAGSFANFASARPNRPLHLTAPGRARARTPAISRAGTFRRNSAGACGQFGRDFTGLSRECRTTHVYGLRLCKGALAFEVSRTDV